MKKFPEFDFWGQGSFNWGSIDTIALSAWPPRTKARKTTSCEVGQENVKLADDVEMEPGVKVVIPGGPLAV